MRHRVPAGIPAAAVACTVMLGAGVASASGGWRIQSTYYPPKAPKQDIALQNVSCPASNACVAIGRSGPVKFLSETWHGTKWSPLLTPYPFGGGERSVGAAAAPQPGGRDEEPAERCVLPDHHRL